MQTRLYLDPTDPTPLWSQLAQRIRELVVSGQLPPGAAVPSVRTLAQELTLNPATVAKALQALVAEGILEVRRGQGTFVAPHPPALAPQELQAQLAQAARAFAARALALGATLAQAQSALQATWDALEAARGGKA